MTTCACLIVVASVFFPGRRNVFVSDAPAQFETTIPTVYRIVNDLGGEERRVTAVDAVAARPGRFSVRAGHLPPGFYHVWRGEIECARFAVVPPDLQKSASNSVAQLDLGRNGVWSRVKNERCAELARLAGVTWVRERFGYGWASFEPRRGQLEVDQMLSCLEPERRCGLNVLFHFMGLPKWAGAVGESGYGADLRDTYRSSAKIAARLAEYIKCWEYWNEPDSWPFGRGPAENLSAGQKALCLGIRSTGMGLPVAMAPPSSIASRDFIADCFENGIAEAFDIYNTHVYSLPEGYPGIFRAHEALLAQHGCSGSARIISEAGSEAAKNDAKARPPRWANEAAVPDADPDTVAWELLPDDVRAEVTMTYVKCWTLAAAYGWSRFYSFCFAYYNEAGGARVWGMLGPGMIATSSFAALAAFNTHVGSRVCQGEIAGLPRGVKGWLFSDGITHTGVCWAERKTGIAFPHVRKVAAMTGDVFAKPPRALDARPVFVEFSAPPPVVPGTAPSTISVGRPDAGGLSPIILDFVRDTSAGRFRVDNHRRHILTRLGERIGGRLHIYNFDSRPFEGDVRGVWPAGWRGPEAFRVSVPPMGRVTREVSFEAPQTFFRSAARVGFDADGGRSRTRATFLCAGELNAERVCALTSLSTKGVDANRLVCTNGVLDYTFQGKTLCSILSAAMPPEVRDADGVTFRLARVGGEGGRPEDSFSYIDVVAMTRGGKSARLSPNIFPVFLDDVREICYTIRFDELTPQVAGDEIETIQLRFNRFGAGKGRTIISDFCLWREKSGRKAEGLCQ